MSKRFFFIILTVFAASIIGAGLFYLRFADNKLPRNPCVSTINNGDFIGDDLKPYSFTGTVTFWLQKSKISIFAVVQEGEDKSILRRELLLSNIAPKSTGIINAIVKKRYIYPTDTASKKRVLFSEKDEDINLVFYRLRRGVYIVYVNDNWVLTCEEKL